MSIPRELLAATNFEAPCICVYGGPGLKKSHATHTLPYPVQAHMFDPGGSASYLPWIARIRHSNDSKWTTYSQEQRETFAALVNAEKTELSSVRPGPYVDVIMYDATKPKAFDDFKVNIGNLDYKCYNSVVVDPLQEFSWATRSYTKGEARKDQLMGEIPFSWAQAQERAQMGLRSLGALRKEGLVVYLIGSQTISKDYVKNPMEKREKGEAAPEAYNIQGTVDLPGQLANSIGHGPDILCHAKLISKQVGNKMVDEPCWVTEPEMLPGGGAWWDAKDRWARLPKMIWPNFRTMFDKLYGEEGKKAIYGATRAQLAS